MKKKNVKNISGKTQMIVGIGEVKEDEIISVPVGFHNANFKLTKKEIKGIKNNK